MRDCVEVQVMLSPAYVYPGRHNARAFACLCGLMCYFSVTFQENHLQTYIQLHRLLWVSTQRAKILGSSLCTLATVLLTSDPATTIAEIYSAFYYPQTS